MEFLRNLEGNSKLPQLISKLMELARSGVERAYAQLVPGDDPTSPASPASS
jgi:hypothetical protein